MSRPLLLLAVAVGAATAALDARASEFSQGRPTRDGVDRLPVWSLQRCTSEGCHTVPMLEHGRKILVDRAECAEIRDAAARQLRGERLVCRPEPDEVARLLGALRIIQGAPAPGGAAGAVTSPGSPR